MNPVPQYLTNSLPSLNEQWNALVKYYENRPQPSRIYKNKGKDPVFTDDILHRELSVVIGRRGYNRETVIGLLNALSDKQCSASPPVGETGISLDEFIRSTITPVAPEGECDMDPLHIKLYVQDGKLQRLLTQVELNWFFTGTYNEYETNSVIGLIDPVAKVPVSISDLINLYNLFYRHRQTRSGLQLKDTDFDSRLGGGKPTKRNNSHRASRSSRRVRPRTSRTIRRRRRSSSRGRLSSKRSTRHRTRRRR
jgi:hypothetical protein